MDKISKLCTILRSAGYIAEDSITYGEPFVTCYHPNNINMLASVSTMGNRFVVHTVGSNLNIVEANKFVEQLNMAVCLVTLLNNIIDSEG